MHNIDMGGYNVQIPNYYINLEELEYKIKNFSFRVRKSECMDLPPKQYVQRYIELTDEQKKAYSELKHQAMTLVQDETISFTNKLTEILKLQQVTCGFIKTDEGEIVPFKNNPKLKELLNTIEETEDKCIIWANYVHNIEEIKKKLRSVYGEESVVSIYGKDSVDVRSEAVKRFQSDDRCRFLVGNPVVGGYGLTLTAAKYVIYYSNNYNLEVRQQSEDRAHRHGQTSTVTYVDLLVRGSIDEMVLASLEGKIKISAKTLGEEVQKWL